MPVLLIESSTAPCSTPPSDVKSFWYSIRTTAVVDGSIAMAALLSQLGADGLDLGVGLQGLVAHLSSPAGLLVAAEGQRGVEDVVAIDPDGAGPEALGHRVGLGDVSGPDAGSQAVGGVVGGLGDVVERPERLGDDDGPEDLLADDPHVAAGLGDHGGLHEVAAFADAAAAGDDLGAVGPAGLEVAGHPRELLVGDERSHLGVLG